MSGQIWITGTIFHFSFLNRAPSGLPFCKATLVRLESNLNGDDGLNEDMVGNSKGGWKT